MQYFYVIQRMRLTPDQREARLKQMSIEQQMRLTHETPDQREAHLEQMSIAQQVRLTHEPLDHREARLEQVSLAQQMRLTRLFVFDLFVRHVLHMGQGRDR